MNMSDIRDYFFIAGFFLLIMGGITIVALYLFSFCFGKKKNLRKYIGWATVVTFVGIGLTWLL